MFFKKKIEAVENRNTAIHDVNTTRDDLGMMCSWTNVALETIGDENY